MARLLVAGLFGGGLLVVEPPASRAQARPAVEAERGLRVARFESRRLLGLLDASRVRHDEATARCVDRRLAQVNSFARTLRVRRARLAAARTRAERAHERRVIRALLRQLREVAREGRACVFEAPAGTTVEVLERPDMPRRDLSRVPDPA